MVLCGNSTITDSCLPCILFIHLSKMYCIPTFVTIGKQCRLFTSRKGKDIIFGKCGTGKKRGAWNNGTHGGPGGFPDGDADGPLYWTVGCNHCGAQGPTVRVFDTDWWSKEQVKELDSKFRGGDARANEISKINRARAIDLWNAAGNAEED